MSKLMRCGIGISCLGVLVLGSVVLDLPCSLLSFQGYAAKSTSLADVLGRKEQLDQRQDAVHHRHEAKEQVAAEVIARRRSLAAAIERFHALDQEWPPNHLGPQTPKDFGMSQDEWDGRQVLRFVRILLADHPDEAAAVVGRLEKELQQLLADRKKRRPAPVEPPTE